MVGNEAVLMAMAKTPKGNCTRRSAKYSHETLPTARVDPRIVPIKWLN
jgi:hypothetical protein